MLNPPSSVKGSGGFIISSEISANPVNFIISSDTDIIPAILDAKAEKKIIIYVGFEGSVSHAMKANCSKTFLVTKKMIKECAKR